MGLPLRVHLHWTSHQTTRHLTKNRQWTRHLNQDQNYKEKTKQCLDIVFCSKQRKESGTPLMLKKTLVNYTYRYQWSKRPTTTTRT